MMVTPQLVWAGFFFLAQTQWGSRNVQKIEKPRSQLARGLTIQEREY